MIFVTLSFLTPQITTNVFSFGYILNHCNYRSYVHFFITLVGLFRTFLLSVSKRQRQQDHWAMWNQYARRDVKFPLGVLQNIAAVFSSSHTMQDKVSSVSLRTRLYNPIIFTVGNHSLHSSSKFTSLISACAMLNNSLLSSHSMICYVHILNSLSLSLSVSPSPFLFPSAFL